MKLQKSHVVFLIILTIIIISFIGLGLYQQRAEAPSVVLNVATDTFAQCIADSGAKFYGAFWCPHCKEQEDMFGTAVKKLPYVECSTPDKTGQTQVCIDKEITGYPTWEFKDGSRATGVQSFQQLSAATGCEAPK